MFFFYIRGHDISGIFETKSFVISVWTSIHQKEFTKRTCGIHSTGHVGNISKNVILIISTHKLRITYPFCTL